MNLIEDIPMC